MSKKVTVAVDGTAGSGKSFLFKKVAEKLGYEMIDTGLMYRAFTYHLFLKKINFKNLDDILNGLKDFNFIIKQGRVYLDNQDVTDKLSTNDVLENINKVTIIPNVREYMMKIQREIGSQPGVIVLGRDITSVVLPNANLKVYLDAPLEIRARRRFEQNKNQGIDDSYEEVLEKMRLRDETDKNRPIGALKIVPEAWYIDSSLQSADETINLIINRIKEIEEKL